MEKKINSRGNFNHPNSCHYMYQQQKKTSTPLNMSNKFDALSSLNRDREIKSGTCESKFENLVKQHNKHHVEILEKQDCRNEDGWQIVQS